MNKGNKEKKISWLEKYEKTKKLIEEELTGTIINVAPVTNKDFFKDKGNFDEREGIGVTVKLDKDDIEFSQWFNTDINNARGIIQSNLKKFEKYYSIVPTIDLKVKVVLDDNGFYRIVF